ncbi:MAG TPA: hypothetical protein PK213_13240 [Deltaproteobacteria bacterium]|nr:hypothetical protein [Deltaproteobacteria bacterium]
MTQSSLAIVIGGVLPAILFGLSGAFAKPSNQAGIGTGLYILCIGLSVAAVGAFCCLIVPDRTISVRSCLYASLVGITWAMAAGLVAFALSRYGVPISRLVPVYNMNTVVTVLIGLCLFAEWRDVHTLKLAVGTLLVVIGGAIVAHA